MRKGEHGPTVNIEETRLCPVHRATEISSYWSDGCLGADFVLLFCWLCSVSGVFGTLELYGQPHSVYHTKLAATAAAGSNTLTLTRPVDWKVCELSFYHVFILIASNTCLHPCVCFVCRLEMRSPSPPPATTHQRQKNIRSPPCQLMATSWPWTSLWPTLTSVGYTSRDTTQTSELWNDAKRHHNHEHFVEIVILATALKRSEWSSEEP